jgi:hypothetical protein
MLHFQVDRYKYNIEKHSTKIVLHNENNTYKLIKK